MASPARFPSGMVNRPPDHPMGLAFTQFDPTRNFLFFDDFIGYTLGAANLPGWVPNAASPAAAAAVVDGAFGVVAFSPQAAAAAFGTYQWGRNATVKSPIFLPVAGKKFWMRSRFKTQFATQNNLYVGAAVASADPFGTEPPDQFAFRSLNAAPEALMLAVGKTAATEVTIALGNTVSDTFSTCTAYYDGRDTVTAWREDDTGLILAAGSVSVVNGTLLPDVLMAPIWAMQTKDGVGALFSIDSLLIVQER